MAIIQVWSAPSCQAGAVCFGALAPWISAGGSEATGTPAGFRVTVTRDVADAASLAEGRCLRVLSQSRGEQWWFVSSVSDSDGDAALVNVTAGPLAQLLTVRGLVRSGSTFAFTPGKQLVSALVSAHVLTNLADDSLSWISAGTFDYPDTIDIGSITRETRAAVLTKIESATGHTARLRALYSAGVLTGFALDIVSDVAAGLDVIPLSVGAQVTQLQRTRDALRAATVAVPFDTAGNPMERPVWVVSAITGTAPAWIALRDPVTGNPWPIREDDQVNGLYLEQRDGTQTLIADSRASDSAVQVASVGTLAVNDLVTVVRDTAGSAVVEVISPSAVASSRGRLVGTVSTSITDARRNYVQNALFDAWATDTAPAGYTIGVGSVGRYPVGSFVGTMNLLVDGAVTAGATSLPLRGGTAGERIYRAEYMVIAGAGAWFAGGTVALFDGTGRTSVSLPSLPALADGTAVTVLTSTAGTQGPDRPASFPSEPVTNIARLLQNGTTIESVASLVRVPSGLVTVNAAAGISIRSQSNATYLGASFWPSLSLRNTAAGTTLATANSATQPANATSHYTLTASAQIAANTTVAARVTAGANAIPSAQFLQWQGVRWLSLWIGAGSAMGLQDGSGSNAMWHRANDVLASAAQATRYVVRGLDLERLVRETGAPALGQSVRLRSDLLGINPTVKIVKLDYVFDQTESLNLELGAIVPRLSGVTVSL